MFWHRSWRVGKGRGKGKGTLGGQLGVGLDPVEQLREVHGAWLSCDFAAGLEYGGRGNAADLIPLAERRIFVGVDLGEPDVRLELGCGLLEKRGHHPAGRAPLRPEVHHERDLAPGQMLVEGLVGQRDGATREQGLLALAAPGRVSETGGGNAIRGLAARTDYDLRGSRHPAQSKSACAPSLEYHPGFTDTGAGPDAGTDADAELAPAPALAPALHGATLPTNEAPDLENGLLDAPLGSAHIPAPSDRETLIFQEI